MDEIVARALAKWPNVPHCYGWLLLDRRGVWRMRDDAAQRAGALGSPIWHAALREFVARNYGVDAHGCWFFQNGPQRVYVELAYAPWVVRLSLHSEGGLALTDHTGGVFAPAGCWIDDAGAVVFADASAQPRAALLHDHDLGLFADYAELPDGAAAGSLRWRDGRSLPIGTIAANDVPTRFGFVRSPAAARPAASCNS